ncbi:Uncharacterised protein [Chromobacterium violaceum]|uniref:Uncharacterized protein n=1 Tax=Chromobacterium violaceum TaxID=536 RepID=A0A3S4IX01_CHRVL|nr:Uncharacterised protein [Chromobacterium violaceum]
MIINFPQARVLRLESEEDSANAIVLFTGGAKPKPASVDSVDVDCYKISYADMALIRDAFKR